MNVINLRRCGRLGDHQPHWWTGRAFTWPGERPERVELWCSGSVRTEGAALGGATAWCDNCGKAV